MTMEYPNEGWTKIKSFVDVRKDPHSHYLSSYPIVFERLRRTQLVRKKIEINKRGKKILK